MTASMLHNLLIAAGVVIDVHEGKLRVSKNVPVDLHPKLAILHTGIRAILTRSAWYGFRSAHASWKDGKDNPLDTKKLIPIGIDRLCITGGKCWNAISDQQMNDNAELWQATTGKAGAV